MVLVGRSHLFGCTVEGVVGQSVGRSWYICTRLSNVDAIAGEERRRHERSLITSGQMANCLISGRENVATRGAGRLWPTATPKLLTQASPLDLLRDPALIEWEDLDIWTHTCASGGDGTAAAVGELSFQTMICPTPAPNGQHDDEAEAKRRGPCPDPGPGVGGSGVRTIRTGARRVSHFDRKHVDYDIETLFQIESHGESRSLRLERRARTIVASPSSG